MEWAAIMAPGEIWESYITVGNDMFRFADPIIKFRY